METFGMRIIVVEYKTDTIATEPEFVFVNEPEDIFIPYYKKMLIQYDGMCQDTSYPFYNQGDHKTVIYVDLNNAKFREDPNNLKRS
jgi:hypothetical protein